MRKVFLDDLPKKRWGNKDVVDWKNSVGHTVRFIYDDIKGKIEIKNYSKYHLTLECDNHIFSVSAGDFERCKIGNKLKNKSHNKHGYNIAKEYIEKHGSIMTTDKNDYKGVHSKISIICIECQNQYVTTYYKFYQNKHKVCLSCIRSQFVKCDARNSNGGRIRYHSFKSVCESIHEINPKIVMLTVEKKYKNIKTKLKFLCTCGDTFEAVAAHVLGGHKKLMCNKCSYQKIDYNEVKSVIENISKSGCSLLTKQNEYKNTSQKIEIRCQCGNIFKTTFERFKHRNKRQCNICSPVSFGERDIEKLLLDYNIPYQTQHYFDDCKNKKPLPFDFAVLNKKSKLICLIEYDGDQHFEPVNFGGISDERALDNFKQTQINDKLKNQYCKHNNIPLIRIPYWQFDKIEEILDKWLRKYDLIHKNENSPATP